MAAAPPTELQPRATASRCLALGLTLDLETELGELDAMNQETFGPGGPGADWERYHARLAELFERERSAACPVPLDERLRRSDGAWDHGKEERFWRMLRRSDELDRLVRYFVPSSPTSRRCRRSS